MKIIKLSLTIVWLTLIGIFTLLSFYGANKTYVSIHLDADIDVGLQIYWKEKNGAYDENNSLQYRLSSNRNIHTFKIDKNSGHLKTLRVDFFALGGTDSFINNILVFNGMFIRQMGFKDIAVPINVRFNQLIYNDDLEVVEYKAQKFQKLKVLGEDPYFEIALNSNGYRTIIYYLSAVLLLTTVFILILMFFYKGKESEHEY